MPKAYALSIRRKPRDQGPVPPRGGRGRKIEAAVKNRGKSPNPKEKKERSEFGEMVITSAFQADFVGSSPIIRKIEGFQGSNRTRTERNGVRHCDKPDRGGSIVREGGLDPIHAKAYTKVEASLGIETS